MKTVTLAATAALLCATLNGTISAQKDTSKTFLKPPVFLIMPGGLTTCTISCPANKSRTDFNVRFQTVIPTETEWLAFVAGAQWGWFNNLAHGPIIFFGGIIPIVPLNNAMKGWLSVSFDPLGVTTAPGGLGTNLVFEGALVSPIGKMMMGNTAFKGLGVYFLLDQRMTQLPLDARGNRDHWNPALVYGVLWQLAP